MNREISQKCRWNKKDTNFAFAYCGDVQQQPAFYHQQKQAGFREDC